MAIAAETRGDESGGFQYTFSLEALYDLQRRATSFSHVFGVMPRIGGLSAEGKAAQFFYVAVSDNYFPAIGIDPACSARSSPGVPDRRRPSSSATRSG